MHFSCRFGRGCWRGAAVVGRRVLLWVTVLSYVTVLFFCCAVLMMAAAAAAVVAVAVAVANFFCTMAEPLIN